MTSAHYDSTVIHNMYKIGDELPDHLIAYHITKSANVISILKNGLEARECIATYYGNYRQKAVYLLACKSDAFDRNIRGVFVWRK